MKKLPLIFIVSFFSAIGFALPGVQAYLPDISGQYVYYRDTTFERESYTGFLYYDEGTYAIRYYAPMVKNKLPEKDIRILFTLATDKNYVDLTGERIITTVTPEDTDIINYMHDILYELTSRRQKITYFTDKTASRQEYEQFGGIVTMVFDALIPIFNLTSITTVDNKVVFSLVTAGQLASSEDNTFFDFKGIPAVLTDKRHSFKQKKTQNIGFAYQKEGSDIAQQIQLDSQWKQSMDNLWLLGDNAILAMDSIPRPAESDAPFVSLLTRRMLLGTEHSYMVFGRLSVQSLAKKTTISSVLYQPITETVTQNFRVLTACQDGSVGFLTLTVFNGAYTKNQAYFQKILDSYRVIEN